MKGEEVRSSLSALIHTKKRERVTILCQVPNETYKSIPSFSFDGLFKTLLEAIAFATD